MRYGFMYLTAIIDIYSKYIVGWSISNTMDATWVVDTLKQAVKQHGAPKYINSDQGSQFTSDEYTEYVKSLNPNYAIGKCAISQVTTFGFS